MSFHYTPIRLAKIKTSGNIHCWQGCRETGPLIHCWWLQSLWSTFWQFLVNYPMTQQQLSWALGEIKTYVLCL